MSSGIDDVVDILPKLRPRLFVQILSEVTDYAHEMMNIPEMWKRTKGAGYRCVILDSGIPDHPDLDFDAKKCASFVPGYSIDACGHGCVEPTTLVQTSFGGIEEIKGLYDRVPVKETRLIHADGFVSWVKDVRALNVRTYSLDERTGAAVVAQVEFLHRTPVNGDVTALALNNGISYKLTPWHEVPVLKRRQHSVIEVVRKRADMLSSDDRLLHASGPAAGNLVHEYCSVEGAPYRECAECGHVLNNYKPRTARCQCKQCGKSSWLEKARTHVVNEDLAYLAGIVATDGHITMTKTHNRVEVSSSDDDILEGVKLVAGRLGFTCTVERPASRVGRVLMNSVELVRALVALGVCVKRKSYDQVVPSAIGKSPRSVAAAFLAGVIDGDGCIAKDNTKNRITTASRRFAYQLSALMNGMGIRCGVQNYGPSTGFAKASGKTGATVYNCSFAAVPEDVVTAMKLERKKARARIPVTRRVRARRVISATRGTYVGDFYDFTVKDYHTYLGNGHFVSNTHCGGIIAATAGNSMGVAGIAPEVEDLYGAVLNGAGQGSVRWIVNGIRWAVDVAGADLISMSLGMPDGMPHMKEMEDACNYAASQGVTVVAASGNEYGRVGQPARYDSVIAVAAVDSKKEHAKFSNTGPQVDFATAGVDVYSTYLRKGYAKLSGTSMAAPALAGVACLLGAEYKATHGGKRPGVDEIRRRLAKIAYDVGADGFDELYGNGIPIFRPGIDWDAPDAQPAPAPATPPVSSTPAAPPNIIPVPSTPPPRRPDPCRSFRSAAAAGLAVAAAGVREGHDPADVLANALEKASEFFRRSAGVQP